MSKWTKRAESMTCIGKSVRLRQRGAAPIEFLLFLPIYVLFLLVLVWVARVRLTEMTVGAESSAEALVEIAESDETNTVPQSYDWGDIHAPALRTLVDGFHSGLALTSGGVRSTVERDTGNGVPMAINPIGAVHDRNELLTHSWEDSVFAFPRAEGEQAQLTLPMQVRGISSGFSEVAAFKRLENFGGGSPLGTLASLASLGIQALDSLNAIRAAIRTLENSISTVTREIDSLRTEEFPDWGRIKSLEDQRDRYLKELSKLTRGKEHLEKAIRIRRNVEAAPDESVE